MQFATPTTNVVRSGVGLVTQARIVNSRTMFRLMSDTLYQNKIGSLVREICCNAYDSHIAAGWPEKAFTVHVPDEFEPFFSVRDYGVGLDDEGVRTVFVNYGDSTKSLDANQIGAFGLGSKTPYAYTDAFTIVAIKDGWKRQYTAFFDEDGCPSVAAMSEVETDEANGVEVIVPVTNQRDFQTFVREIRDQLTFFNVKPELTNYDVGIDWLDVTSGQTNYLNCEDITLGDYHSNVRGVWAVQGVVGYKVDVELVAKNVSNANAEFLKLISQSAVITFELGKLEVIASREGISYTPATFASFEAKLDKARAALTATVKAQVDGLVGPWNKARELNSNPTLSKYARVANAGFASPYYYKTSAGYYLDLARIANIDGKAPQDDGEIEVLDDEKVGDENLATNLNLSFRQYASEVVRRVTRWKEKGVGKTAKADETLVILFRDTADKPVVRIREFMETRSRREQVFVVENRDGSLVTEAQRNEILARIGEGFTGYKLLSDVALPAPDARASNGAYKAPTAYTYEAGDDRGTTRYWAREYSKLAEWEEGAYYTIVDRCNINMGSDAGIVLEMADAGLLDRPVAAIRAKDADKLDATKWIRIEDKAKEIIDTITASKTLANAHALAMHDDDLFDFMDSGVMGAMREAMARGEIGDKSPLRKLSRIDGALTKLKARAASRGYTNLARTAFSLRPKLVNDYKEVLEKRIAAIEGDIRNRYPLLAQVSSDWVYDSKNRKHDRVLKPDLAAHLVQYVNLFDNATAGA